MDFNLTINHKKDDWDFDFELLKERRSFMFKMIALFAGIIVAGFKMFVLPIDNTCNSSYLIYPFMMAIGVSGIVSVVLYFMTDSYMLMSKLKRNDYLLKRYTLDTLYHAFIKLWNTWGIILIFGFLVVVSAFSYYNVYSYINAFLETYSTYYINILGSFLVLMFAPFTFIQTYKLIKMIKRRILKKTMNKNVSEQPPKNMYLAYMFFYFVLTIFMFLIFLKVHNDLYYVPHLQEGALS